MSKRKRKPPSLKQQYKSHHPDPARLAVLESRIKPFARFRVYAGYAYLLILLIFGVGNSLTGFLYFIIGTIFIMAGGFQRIGAGGTLLKAADDDVDRLTMDGPYGRCRHPMYFGSLLYAIGFAFLAGPFGDLIPSTRANILSLVPWGLVLLLVSLYPIYIKMMKIEEEFLTEKFGPVFEGYRNAVPCFFPRRGFLTRDPDWKFSPEALKRNRETKNFTGVMIVYGLFMVKLIYQLIVEIIRLNTL